MPLDSHESVHEPREMPPLHRHADAYAALVLDGDQNLVIWRKEYVVREL